MSRLPLTGSGRGLLRPKCTPTDDPSFDRRPILLRPNRGMPRGVGRAARHRRPLTGPTLRSATHSDGRAAPTSTRTRLGLVNCADPPTHIGHADHRQTCPGRVGPPHARGLGQASVSTIVVDGHPQRSACVMERPRINRRALHAFPAFRDALLCSTVLWARG
jgi:hypothetical protein